MAYYSAVQRSSTQRTSTQIKGGSEVDNGWLGGGYIPAYQKYKNEEYQRRKIAEDLAKLKRIDDEIAEAERKRLEALEARNKEKIAKREAKKQAALEAALLNEIGRLRIERAWLMRLIADEESILVIMMMKRKRII